MRRSICSPSVGVGNASSRVLALALQQFPTIDRRQIYAAGHSSAGTLALLLGARDQRIQAVAAYTPVMDVAAFHGEEGIKELEALPGFDGFFRSSSPVTYRSMPSTMKS